MVLTPWGNVEEPQRRGDATEELATEDRRERLYAAMVASCELRGYESTSVADLLLLSGVSRATFYEHFENKADCFRATIEVLLKAAVAGIAASYESDLPWEERARLALQGFLELAAAQPAAAKVCLVEYQAAGSAGVEAVEFAVDRLSNLGLAALERMPGRERMPDELARAIIGGFHRVLYRRLHQDRAAELPALAPQLWDWAMAYLPPPEPLRARGRKPHLDGDRLPPFAAVDPAERIIRAFATATMEKGYPSTTIADVAAIASISQRTLYEHFSSKGELLAAALDSSGAQLAAAVLPAIHRSRGWPSSVRMGFNATCSFLAAEPAFAYLRELEVYAAGPEAIALRDETGERILGEMLAGDDVPDVDPIYFEAIEGAVYSVLHDRLRGSGPASLLDAAPLLTYVALAPILGAERACEVANDDGRKR